MLYMCELLGVVDEERLCHVNCESWMNDPPTWDGIGSMAGPASSQEAALHVVEERVAGRPRRWFCERVL